MADNKKITNYFYQKASKKQAIFKINSLMFNNFNNQLIRKKKYLHKNQECSIFSNKK